MTIPKAYQGQQKLMSNDRTQPAITTALASLLPLCYSLAHMPWVTQLPWATNSAECLVVATLHLTVPRGYLTLAHAPATTCDILGNGASGVAYMLTSAHQGATHCNACKSALLAVHHQTKHVAPMQCSNPMITVGQFATTTLIQPVAQFGQLYHAPPGPTQSHWLDLFRQN